MSLPSDFDLDQYWEERYSAGRGSGAGSHGRLAKFKALFVNNFYKNHSIQTHIDFGMDDGHQLSLFKPTSYIGVDVSRTLLKTLDNKFSGKRKYKFIHIDELQGIDRCDLASSLDVIYQLVDDTEYQIYMRRLFLYARRFVVIYSSNMDQGLPSQRIRHRRFTDFVMEHRPDWTLVQHLPNPYPHDPANPRQTSFADFFVFAAPGEMLRG